MPLNPGPMARFEQVKTDAAAPNLIFTKLTERMTLKQIAAEWQLPKGRFVEWFTTTYADLYDAALKVVAADLAFEALDVAGKTQIGETRKTKSDGTVEVTEEDMLGHRRLYSETLLKMAAKLDRQRFGDTLRVEKTVNVSVDAGLLGTAGELLRLVASRPQRVIEHEPAEDTITLPPPSVDII